MTWLVFGVSCLLVLAGAVSIISGAPIIQLERGWAEVISGTVALSSGGVVFALAGILMRLESIRDTLASRALPVAAEQVVVTEPVPAAEPFEARPPALTPEPEPRAASPVAKAEALVIAAPAPAPAEPPAPAEDSPSQGLWKRVKRPDPELQKAETLVEQGFPDRVLSDAPRDTEPFEKSVLVPAHPVPAAPVAAAEPETQPAAAQASDDIQIGWLERSVFKGRPPRLAGDAPASRTEPSVGRPSIEQSDDRAEPAIMPVAAARPVVLNGAVPESAAAAEPEPTPDLASEQHQDATVIGRYQAGSASYVMYSDGTIEVETESGEMHRFGSMDELKAFIAQQDSAVS